MLMLYGPSCVESVRGRVVYTAVTHSMSWVSWERGVGGEGAACSEGGIWIVRESEVNL